VNQVVSIGPPARAILDHLKAEELVKALSNCTAEVRQFAARTLGSIHDEAALPALVTHLSDDVEVRREAAEPLVRVGNAGVQAVLEAVMHSAPDERHNLAVLHVLEGAPMELWQVLKPVVHALRGPESALAGPIAAAKALRQLEHPSQLTTVS